MAYVDPAGLLSNPRPPAGPSATIGSLSGGGGLQGLLAGIGQNLQQPASPVAAQFMANAFGAGADGKTPFSGIPEAIVVKQNMAIQQQQAERQAKADQRQEEQLNQTVNWLSQNHPDLAEMVKGGLSVNDAYGEAIRRQKGGSSDESFFATLIQGNDENGNPIYLQPGNRGSLKQLALPEGFVPQSRFDKVDLGNQWLITDTTTGQRQILPKSGDVPTGFVTTDSGEISPMAGSDQDRARIEADLLAGQRAQAADQRADIVINSIDTALGQAHWSTTGPVGSISRGLGLTGAVDLDKTIDTVRANIGFNELQQMREMSPTGGALGQVAVQELNMLQSVVASLDPTQGEDQLRRNLQTIKDLLERQKAYRQQALEDRRAAFGQGSGAPTQQNSGQTSSGLTWRANQ